VIGRWFFLYLILDLYSRKIVGWEVHGCMTEATTTLTRAGSAGSVVTINALRVTT
jgi:transposase InsO family protein